jgi:hypothetical protein
MPELRPFQDRLPSSTPLDHFSTQIRPDFVLTGIRHGNGVMLFASKTLTQAVLEVEADLWGFGFGDHFSRPVHYTTTLSLEMNDYVLITAPSYGAAFHALFKTWNPDNHYSEMPEQQEIEP